MSEAFFAAAAAAAVAFMTWVDRSLPYLLFGGRRKLPKTVLYLGSVLPPAIMVILVVYCLRNISFDTFPFGLAEIISVLLVIFMQLWKKNIIISIILGTACYMVLIRTVFPV